jgi:hypothetical protein
MLFFPSTQLKGAYAMEIEEDVAVEIPPRAPAKPFIAEDDDTTAFSAMICGMDSMAALRGPTGATARSATSFPA